ncbi:hypothetical protein TNCV_4852431 [Trichonephila clavipes]|nr:hypothetical protein TNCV_4852431 [Trichonephila clavipes]
MVLLLQEGISDHFSYVIPSRLGELYLVGGRVHLDDSESHRKRCILQRTIDKYSACVEVGKPIDENSACVEVGTTHKHLRRGDKSNNFKNYFSSNDITCEEVKSVDSQRFLHWIHRTCEQQGSQKKKRFSSGLHGNTAADSVQSEWPLWHAAKSNAVFARRCIEMKLKLLDIRAELERRRRTREVREQALPSEYHRQTYL